MKDRKCVYTMVGKYGGGLLIYLLPKHKAIRGAYGGIDDIEILWASSKEAKENKPFHRVYVNEVEALALIQGITYALIEKRGILLQKRKRCRRKR